MKRKVAAIWNDGADGSGVLNAVHLLTCLTVLKQDLKMITESLVH